MEKPKPGRLTTLVAVTAFERAFALARKPEVGREDLVPRILSGMGTSQAYLGQIKVAEANIQRALALDLKTDPQSVDVARDLEALGATYLTSNRFEPARGVLERAVDIRTRTQGAQHPLAVQDLNSLGYAAYMQHDSVTAERLWRKTLDLNERIFGPNHPEVAVALNNVALIMVERRDYAGAEPLLQRAVAINLAQRGDYLKVSSSSIYLPAWESPDVALVMSPGAKKRSTKRWSRRGYTNTETSPRSWSIWRTWNASAGPSLRAWRD